jgi:hypothetical protein
MRCPGRSEGAEIPGGLLGGIDGHDAAEGEPGLAAQVLQVCGKRGIGSTRIQSGEDNVHLLVI